MVHRYAGTTNQAINVVSETPFSGCVVVPDELAEVSAEQLMTDWRIGDDGRFNSRTAYRTDAKQLRVAFVGNWRQQCGISLYNEQLFPEIAQHVGEFRLFIERNDTPTGDEQLFGTELLPDSQIIRCWKRRESTAELARELNAYNPDVVLIGHEWGIWEARGWLSLMSQTQHLRVITIMHSVFEHRDKSICEAAMSEIVVHLQGARDLLLQDKHISAKVSVIPHGTTPYVDRGQLWNHYRSDHTFIQTGFGSPYKRFEQCIEATALLRPRYPDVFFTALFSHSPHGAAEHTTYFNQLMGLVERLDLHDHVAIIRGFQSDYVVETYLRMNRVAVFPYAVGGDHRVFGSSGAAPLAMSYGVPVITSSGLHFADLPSVRADSPEEIAAEVGKFFSQPANVRWQLERQNRYLRDNRWEVAAGRFVDVFLNR